MKLAAYVAGIGVLGPGLTDWPHAAAVLRGEGGYVSAATTLRASSMLPPAERRRTGRVVNLALAVAGEATTHAAIEPAQLAGVFSSSGGDGYNCHALCEALTLEERVISPTRFSNSVHNAAAGYWSIATNSQLESTVLCAFDASFCAGLLEALTHVCVEGRSVLLVAYDTEYPQPMHAKRPLPDAFGVALVLTGHRTAGCLAHIEAALSSAPADALPDAALERLRGSIPAARSLPLLRRFALRRPAAAVLDYLEVSRVSVHVEPC